MRTLAFVGSIVLLGFLSFAALSNRFRTSATNSVCAAAEKGDAEAQAGCGLLAWKGTGVPQDDVTAVKWFRKGAARKNALAQAGLGAAYQSGRGVPRDRELAIKWLKLAADQGESSAQHNLAVELSGDGPDRKNVAETIRLLRLAARQRADSKATLAGLLYERHAGPADLSEALNLARDSAHEGYPHAYLLLAYFAQQGVGMPADQAAAKRYLTRAAELGSDPARKYLQMESALSDHIHERLQLRFPDEGR